MKLNYSFSKREIALILALVLVLVGLLYYRFVYLKISEQADDYDTTDIEAQIQVEQLHLTEWQKMQDEIDRLGKVSTSSLETYDNQKNEINLLNDIFEPVIRYNFSFEKPVATGDTVRRNVKVSFTTIDYQSALDIINQLHDSKYRVLLQDLSISPGDLTSDYLTALATEALRDPTALTQLKKQVRTLIKANYEIDPYVMKVYKGEPITEAPETEPPTEPVSEDMSTSAEGAEQAAMAQETTTEEMADQALPAETIAVEENSQDTQTAGGLFEGGEGTTDGSISEALMPDAVTGDAGTVEASEGTTGTDVPAGGTVETLEDGTIVAPQAPVDGTQLLAAKAVETETQSETETEKPVQTLENSLVNVSLSMTFYETAYGAESLDGLIIQTPETTDAAS